MLRYALIPFVLATTLPDSQCNLTTPTCPRLALRIPAGECQTVANTFDIDTTRSLDVALGALPGTVLPGETTTLEATVAGGVPPYTYVWTPAEAVLGEGQAVTATPSLTTVYSIDV